MSLPAPDSDIFPQARGAGAAEAALRRLVAALARLSAAEVASRGEASQRPSGEADRSDVAP
jgi:hypothetical protein